jgi:hypothetical protein
MAQSVTQEFDRFSGQTKITYVNHGKVALGKPVVSIFSNVGGETPISGVRFMVAPTLDRGYQPMPYVGCDRVEWLIDGKPMKFGPVLYDFKHVRTARIDFISQAIEPSGLAAMGNASTVEYRICGVTQGTFDAGDIAGAREVAARTAAAGGIAPLSPASPPLAPNQPAQQSDCVACKKLSGHL